VLIFQWLCNDTELNTHTTVSDPALAKSNVHLLALEGVVAGVQVVAVAQPLICPGEQHLPAATTPHRHQETTM
jgi:hypothetical protein